MNRHLITSKASLIEALTSLNRLSGSAMVLFVTDESGKLLGSLTDGDIRRALIAGNSLEDSVEVAAHRDFRFVYSDDIDVRSFSDFRRLGINLIPVLDRDGRMVDLLDLTRRKSYLPLRAVLMAGGKGERLRPMTLETPKPLLAIEGKAIIDYNIEALAACGIKDIVVTTNYLAEKLEKHFSEPVAGVRVRTVRESVPLGTVGAVALTDTPAEGATLVMNSDLITTISFEEMYIRHISENADITVAAIPYQVSVPYAILTFDKEDGTVRDIDEKPSYSYYANAGIYIFSNRILNTYLSSQVRTDATDLIQKAITDGAKVIHYPVKGTWIDVGSPVDFRQAAELMRHHNAMTLNK